MGERFLGFELDVAFGGVEGRLEIPGLGERHREPVPRHGVGVVLRQRFAVRGNRLVGPPFGVVLHAGLVVRARLGHGAEYRPRFELHKRLS